MRKIVKLKESDISYIVKKIINEQGIGNYTKDFNDAAKNKYGQSVGPGKLFQKGEIIPPITMPSNLFKNGVDKIDVNSQAFKSGVDGIKKAIASKGQNITIFVEGGASKVGEAEGYDNAALAQRRANNFIAQVKNLFPSVTFKVGTKVGNSTKKNSPEAEAEQYVKLTFPGSISADKIAQAVDNTQSVFRPMKGVGQAETKKEDGIEYVKVCYWVPMTNMSSFANSIKSTGAKRA